MVYKVASGIKHHSKGLQDVTGCLITQNKAWLPRPRDLVIISSIDVKQNCLYVLKKNAFIVITQGGNYVRFKRKTKRKLSMV